MVTLIELFLQPKTKNYTTLLWLYQQKASKNYQNFLAEDLKHEFIRINTKQKVRIKMQKMSIEFPIQTLKELIDCLCWFIQTKMIVLKELIPKSIIYQKILSRTTTSSVMEWNGNFYNQINNSGIKLCEEINNLATEQGEDYTAGCLLYYEYIKLL